jgi:hypothetical protein
MGLMRWLRGGDGSSSASAGALSSALAEIDGLFRPSRHKQTEYVESARRRRVDVHNGAGIDLDRGVAVIRAAGAAAPHDGPGAAAPDRSPGAAAPHHDPGAAAPHQDPGAAAPHQDSAGAPPA